MDHAMHTPLDANQLTEATLLDAHIYGPDDENIGTISHVHGAGADTQVIVDVGGFLGIGAKAVSIKASVLNFMRDEDGDVHATTSWTKEDFKSLPEHYHSS